MLIRIVAHDERDIEKFEYLLRGKYARVICTGLLKNTRPPLPEGYRAFFTILMEDAE